MQAGSYAVNVCGVSIRTGMWAAGQQEGLGSLMSLNVRMQLLLPKYIAATLVHLQRVVLVTLFCVCARLEARIILSEQICSLFCIFNMGVFLVVGLLGVLLLMSCIP